MFRNVASKVGLVGLTLVVGALGLEACSSSDSGTPTATGGTGSHTGGTSSSTGGTSSSQGGTSSSQGGTSSSQGGSGTAGSGGAGTGPFTCAKTAASCGSWTTFPQSTMNSWGSGMFTGGITVFGTGFTRSATGTDSVHVSGMVTGYGYGFGLYFSSCSDLSKYTGLSFKVKGMTDATAMLQVQVQSNEDYPWQPRPMDMKGSCTAPDATMAYSVCIAPSKNVAVTGTEATVTVAFADLAAGMPKATLDPTQVVGIQFAMPWAGTTGTPYAADITISDIELTGGGTAPSCAMGAGGTGAGGAGGTGGTGGSGGAATGGGGAGGTGGAAAGSGGTGG